MNFRFTCNIFSNYSSLILIILISLVISSYREPFKGWIDNINGPIGIAMGISLGIIRVLHADLNAIPDLVPVDYSTNALLASAYDVASSKYKLPPIYNYVSSPLNPVTWGKFTEWTADQARLTPSIKQQWCIGYTATSSTLMASILNLFYHTIPAILGDAILRFTGTKPQLI